MKPFACIAAPRRAALAAVGAVAFAWALPAPAATLLFKDGRTVEGTDLRVNAQGDYVITMSTGQRTYPAAQVQEATADRPAAYDQASQLVQAQRYDEALSLLEQIASAYRGLGWDDQANYQAARIHAGRGAYEQAEAGFRKLSPRFRERPEVRIHLAQAQVETGAYAEAEGNLDELIRGAPRDIAARAQILRGDLKLKRRQLEPAVQDYLRTVVLFEAVREVQPEALFKAGEALEELRDARAKDLFATLQREYPATDYAARAREK